jgi:3-methylfumaryl-CoA hydratase
MAESTITAAEIEGYQSQVGRTMTDHDMAHRHVHELFTAVLGVEELDMRRLPPMWHYGLFLPKTATNALGPDGHPPRGGFMPAVSLPRRMFAGSDMTFVRPLALEEEITRVSRILSVTHKRGHSGDLVFVVVGMAFEQAGKVCIEEKQTIVYRGAGDRVAPVADKPRSVLLAEEASEDWLPTPVELFRFSAVTFNAHRIHYDQDYVTAEEGYPSLVVHGPLQAMRLCHFARRVAGRPMTRFSFRGERPAFVNQSVRLIATPIADGLSLRAERADGLVSMSASAVFDRP